MYQKKQIPRVTQIQVSRASDIWNGIGETIIALCVDGSIWRLVRESPYGFTTYVYWKPVTLDSEP